MTEFSTDTSASLATAIRPDGFVDFYELLGVPGDASPDLINTRINDLYTRSQNNREHRHLAKRREAETLLALMPRCMDVLRDPANRAAYDTYAVSARAGAAPTDFESFMNDIIRESQAARSGLLGFRDDYVFDNAADGSGSTVIKADVTAATGIGTGVLPAAPAGAAAKASSSNTAKVAARPSPRRAPAVFSIWRVIGAFVIVFLLSDVGFNAPSWVTFLLASAAAAFVAVRMRREVARQRASGKTQRTSA